MIYCRLCMIFYVSLLLSRLCYPAHVTLPILSRPCYPAPPVILYLLISLIPLSAVPASSNGTSVTSSAATNGGTPVRELNYAELDLPRSDAIGFPQTHRQNGTAAASVVSI